jgi:hypothetical protein
VQNTQPQGNNYSMEPARKRIEGSRESFATQGCTRDDLLESSLLRGPPAFCSRSGLNDLRDDCRFLFCATGCTFALCIDNKVFVLSVDSGARNARAPRALLLKNSRSCCKVAASTLIGSKSQTLGKPPSHRPEKVPLYSTDSPRVASDLTARTQVSRRCCYATN